jgi:hypothetical protein
MSDFELFLFPAIFIFLTDEAGPIRKNLNQGPRPRGAHGKSAGRGRARPSWGPDDGDARFAAKVRSGSVRRGSASSARYKAEGRGFRRRGGLLEPTLSAGLKLVLLIRAPLMILEWEIRSISDMVRKPQKTHAGNSCASCNYNHRKRRASPQIGRDSAITGEETVAKMQNYMHGRLPRAVFGQAAPASTRPARAAKVAGDDRAVAR